jgi:hypothetical protein
MKKAKRMYSPTRVYFGLGSLSFAKQTWVVVYRAAIARLFSIALGYVRRDLYFPGCRNTLVFFTRQRSQAFRTCFRFTRKTRWSRLSSPVLVRCSSSENEATAAKSLMLWGKPLGRSFGCHDILDCIILCTVRLGER